MNGAAGRITSGAALVGRHDALRAFTEALDGPRAGAFQFLVLSGEPGAGKTRLLTELHAEAAGRKLTTLAGRAAEFEQELPFGVVVDALEDQVETSLPGLAERLGAEISARLATVLPALRAAAPGHDSETGPRSEQAQQADHAGRTGQRPD
jgi:predicted ATPase